MAHSVGLADGLRIDTGERFLQHRPSLLELGVCRQVELFERLAHLLGLLNGRVVNLALLDLGLARVVVNAKLVVATAVADGLHDLDEPCLLFHDHMGDNLLSLLLVCLKQVLSDVLRDGTAEIVHRNLGHKKTDAEL